MKSIRTLVILLTLVLLLSDVSTMGLCLIRASEAPRSTASMSSHVPIDIEATEPKTLSTSPASLKDQITKVTVALPQPLEGEAGSWCTWGGCSISPRLYHEPLADDRTLVWWSDSSGNGHASVVSGSTVERTFDFPAKSVRGLVAHDDGTFAVLLWDPDTDIIWLSKRDKNGGEIWTANLNSDIAIADFWLGDGRLAYGNGLYIAYFAVVGISGGFTGHHGDQLTFVDDNGVIQDGGWDWGCSHSMAELVSYRADLDQFIAVCSSDCYPGKGIFINSGHQVYEADGNCGGNVSAQLGQFALGEGSWKLVFNALDRPGYEGHGIALATIDENYQSSFTWLTHTDGAYEQDPVIARLGSDEEVERYLVGWTTTNDHAYWLGIIDGKGYFRAGPEKVSSAGVKWGNRDDSFRMRADGSVSWVQGDPTSTNLDLFRFEKAPPLILPYTLYLPLAMRDFDPSNVPTPTPEWRVECVDCPRYFADMTDHTLALDTDGQPHVVYGGNHLYYAWRDGTRWYTETVDSTESVGRYASLALDSDDHPHIGYYDVVNKNLKYATWDGSIWTVQTVDDRRDVGLGASLALDSAGHPHLVYYDRTNQDFHYTRWKYAHWDGSTWIIEPVGGTASWHDWGQASLTLDSQDRPHVSYGQGADGSLKYATKVGGIWTVQTVDAEIGSGVVSSVAVDSDDQPRISYEVESVSPHEIRYARWSGTSWYTQTVSQINAWGGGYPSLVLDSAGQPHISFHDWGDSQVKYARWSGSEWIIENVGNAGWWAGRNSLVLDTSDQPHIAYHSWSPFQIRYAAKSGESWTLETVDTGGSVGEWSSIDVDSSDHLHIGYQDGLNMRLKYAFYDGTVWASQTVDEAWYGGEHASLALNSAGYPHISYRGDSQLRYARWDGSDWNIETIDASGSAGGYSSLALDSDNHPHISHHNWGDHTLRYAAWDGQSWITRTVDDIGDGGSCSHTSIAVDADGCPAIAYYDAESQDLKIAHWDGADWALQNVDSEEDVGCSPAMAFDSDGEPHIAYYDSSEGKIRYASWNGTDWLTQTVASQGTWSPCSALVMDVDDRPHIAYTNGYSERDPMYAYWDGMEWVVETIESDNNAGSWISLALDLSGCPHVSYRDDTNGALKHAWRR